MARHRVFALRVLDETPCDRRSARLRRATLKLLDIPEAEGFEVGEVEPPDRSGDIPEGVRTLVAVFRRVRERPGPNRVEHDDAGARHGAILLR
jgi:hypothetical protein